MNSYKLPVSMIIAALAAGCVATTPQTDASFGAASMALRAQQQRDPAASVKNEKRLVDGMEGQSAGNAVDQYYKSFTKPVQPMTILNLGVAGPQ